MVRCWKKIYCTFVFLFCFLQIAIGDVILSSSIAGSFSVGFLLIAFFDRKIKTMKIFSYLALMLSVCVVLAIFLSVLFQSIDFFEKYSFLRFLFGTEWAPNVPHKCNELNCFGILSLLSGTLLITAVAICISVPIALLSSIYLSEYSSKEFRKISSSVIEVFSGMPTVVYGYFALNFVHPAVSGIADLLGGHIESENALVAGATVGFMILPSTISLMVEGLKGVPKIMRYGSFAVGATSLETTFRVILPTAFPALVCAVLLSVSRAIGETMIVLMTAGVNSNLTFNPLDSVTTITIQIVVLLTGETEYSSIKVLASYALTAFLFIFTFSLNLLANLIVKRYNKKFIKV